MLLLPVQGASKSAAGDGILQIQKIAMLLSGGVDSSVALARLVAEGHDVTAFYLKIWLEDDLAFLGECPWEEDLGYARAVCAKFNVPLKVVSLQKAYWDRVVSHTVAELQAGRTPSPDILCNQRVKFGAFTDHIDASFTKIATGHYARVEEVSDGYVLRKGVDPVKDQSYFLSHLSQAQLARCWFPLGGFLKEQIREFAAAYDLPNKDRRDSQGICFLGKIKYNEFVKCHLGERRGLIIEKKTGNKLGNHNGYWFHTIGQRKGLGLSGGPWFVVGKDISKNIVYVEQGIYKPDNQRTDFAITNLSWLHHDPAPNGQAEIKIRHGARTVKSSYKFEDSDQNQATMAIQMAEPDGGIAPGQYAVLYQGDQCLGGGVIANS